VREVRDRGTRKQDYTDYDHSPEKQEAPEHDIYGYEEEYDYKYKDRYAEQPSYYQG
jgi:hypothetical protein